MQTKETVLDANYKFKGFEMEPVSDNIKLKLDQFLSENFDSATDSHSNFTAKIQIVRTNFQKDDDDSDRIKNENQVELDELLEDGDLDGKANGKK